MGQVKYRGVKVDCGRTGCTVGTLNFERLADAKDVIDAVLDASGLAANRAPEVGDAKPPFYLVPPLSR